jgi:glycerol kinase
LGGARSGRNLSHHPGCGPGGSETGRGDARRDWNHQSAGDGRLWDRKTLTPVAPAIVWQDRRTAERCRRAQGRGKGEPDSAEDRTGARSLISPAPSSSGCCAIRSLRRRAERGELAAGRSTPGSSRSSPVARFTSPITPTRRALCCMISPRAIGTRLCWRCSGCRASILPSIAALSSSRGDRSRLWVLRLPIAGIAGDQQAAAVRTGCVHPAWRRTPTGPGPFSSPSPDKPNRFRKMVSSRHARADPGRAGVRSRGQRLHRRCCNPVVTRWPGADRDRGRSRGLARSVPDTGGVYMVPAFVGWDPRTGRPRREGRSLV